MRDPVANSAQANDTDGLAMQLPANLLLTIKKPPAFAQAVVDARQVAVERQQQRQGVLGSGNGTDTGMFMTRMPRSVANSISMPVNPADMRAISFKWGECSSSGASSLKSERVIMAVASRKAERTLDVLGGTTLTLKWSCASSRAMLSCVRSVAMTIRCWLKRKDLSI